jgi:hypothetical protein
VLSYAIWKRSKVIPAPEMGVCSMLEGQGMPGSSGNLSLIGVWAWGFEFCLNLAQQDTGPVLVVGGMVRGVRVTAASLELRNLYGLTQRVTTWQESKSAKDENHVNGFIWKACDWKRQPGKVLRLVQF